MCIVILSQKHLACDAQKMGICDFGAILYHILNLLILLHVHNIVIALKLRAMVKHQYDDNNICLMRSH